MIREIGIVDEDKPVMKICAKGTFLNVIAGKLSCGHVYTISEGALVNEETIRL